MQRDRGRRLVSVSGDPRMWTFGSGVDPRTPLAWQQRHYKYQQQSLQRQQAFPTSYADRLAVLAGMEKITMMELPLKRDYSMEMVPTPGSVIPTAVPVPIPAAIPMPIPTAMPMTIPTAVPGSSSDTRTSTSSPTTDTSTNSTLTVEVNPRSPMKQEAVPVSLYPNVVTTETWNGEPCPVHHLTGLSAIMSPPPPPPASMIPSPADSSPCPGSPASLPPVSKGGLLMLLPPMLRPRPLVIPADQAGAPEPLPVREPKHTLRNPLLLQAQKMQVKRRKREDNLEGYTIVLWLILIVITIGIVLAAVLRFVFI